MPIDGQVQHWEALEFGDGHNHLIFCVLVNGGDEEWLQSCAASEARENSAEYTDSADGTSDDSVSDSSISDDATSQAESSQPLEETTHAQTAPPEPVASQHEYKSHRIAMHSSRTDQWSGLIATLDTGTDENWISQRIVDRLSLDVSKGLSARRLTFNGQRVSACETVRSTWRSQGRGVSHEAAFRVVANVPFDVLFGRNLLNSEQIGFLSKDRGAQPVWRFVSDAFSEKERSEEDRDKEGRSRVGRKFQLICGCTVAEKA